MALIISGKTTCILCDKVMEKDDKIKGFPAFLPYDHKYGKFSDAAFHETCFLNDPDGSAVEDMFAVYEMILKSKPRNLKTLEEAEAWTKEAFKDWPPVNGVVIFQPLFPEDSEEGGFWMDKDSYDAMCAEEDRVEKEREERRAERRRQEWESWWLYHKDD